MTGGLHDEIEYNIFNDFGCHGITRSMNTGVEAHYERKIFATLFINHYKTGHDRLLA